MDFASSILQSAASSLAAAAKPTLASHYTPDQGGKPLQVGVWRVTRAKHVSSGKLVSLWAADKASLVHSASTSGAGHRDRDHADRLKRALDVLKKEAGLPCGPLHGLSDSLTDTVVAGRFVVEVEAPLHPRNGRTHGRIKVKPACLPKILLL